MEDSSLHEKNDLAVAGLQARIVELEQAGKLNQTQLKKLQTNEERLRLLVESVKDYAIFMLDPTGKIISWNLGAERIKGYKAQEIIGQHFSKFYPESDLAWDKPGMELREAIKTGRFEDEGWRIRKDGSRFWANVVITALFDREGQLRGFSKVTRDMTERKHAEDLIKEANTRLEQRVQERTAQLEIAIQVREELLQREQQARRQAEQAERVSLFLSEVSKKLVSSLDLAATLQNVSQLIVPTLASFWAVFIKEETIAQSLKLAEFHSQASRLGQPIPPELLEINGSLLSKLLPEWGQTIVKSDIAVILLEDSATLNLQPLATDHDEPGDSSAVAPENLAISLKSIIGLPLIVRDTVTGVLIFGLRDQLSEGEEGFYEHQPLAATPHFDLRLAQELASRIALAVDNARFYRQAQEAVGLRDEFLAVAAHELKTPLTSLKGYTQILTSQLEKNQLFNPERTARALKVINQQTDKLNLLIQHLLDISRLQSGKMVLQRQPVEQPVEVVSLITGVVESTIAALPVPLKHEIKFETHLDQLNAWLDPLRFEQVVTNLVNNAIKYSPAGGWVKIELKRLDQAEITSLLADEGLSTTGTFLYLSVTDQGIGIAEENRHRLFERFYQAHSADYSSGMGLGLFISQQIIELHGGRIWAEFPAEGGSRFVVVLPLL